MSFLMTHISRKATKMSVIDKHCVLMWDEVALNPHLDFDAQRDEVIGFEDWGEVRTHNIADHALVFMLKGLFSEWKIPLAYHFCASQTKQAQLTSCIKQVVQAVAVAGLTIEVSVCDQGSSNIAAIKSLKEDTKRSKFRAHQEYGTIVQHSCFETTFDNQ